MEVFRSELLSITMRRITALFFIMALLPACSPHESVGRRITLAKGNVSLILPDSFLFYSKVRRWGPCCSSCSYGEMNAFFHNADSSVIVSVYVTAFPNALQRTLPWHAISNEKRQRSVLRAKNMGLAIIEHYTADSVARTIDIEYHLPKRPGPSRRGQASYERSLAFYGPQRTFRFWFFGPDKEAIRRAFSIARASVRIDPTYLQVSIKSYPESQHLD